MPLPSGISVPAWAYMDVAGHGIFDEVAAEAQSGQAPDSSAGPGPTSSFVFPTTPGVGSPLPTTPLMDSNSHHNNVGEIVGGVLGGIVDLCAIVIVVIYVVRIPQKIRREDGRPQQVVLLHPPAAPPTPGEKLQMRSSVSPTGPPPPAPLKLYDPSDPL
ncbi:hypothetical protein BU17DRAFT_85403 [Hysterangium stoloniferum]|nr:hypothetical protein BU17DRAFT_85403 [Hysterangium stoloniferum]